MPIWQPLSKYCRDRQCPSLEEAKAAAAASAHSLAAGHCAPGSSVLLDCADGHFVVKQFGQVGFDTQHFDASGKLIGAEAPGGVYYGSRPDCEAKSVLDYCAK